MLVACPSCQRQLNVPETAVGKQVRCPVCQAVLKIPAAPDPVPVVDPLPAPARRPAVPPPLPDPDPPAQVPAPAPAPAGDGALFDFGEPSAIQPGAGGSLDFGTPDPSARAGAGTFAIRNAVAALRAAGFGLTFTPLFSGALMALGAFLGGVATPGRAGGGAVPGLLGAVLAFALAGLCPLAVTSPLIVVLYLGARATRTGSSRGLALAAGIVALVCAVLLGLSLLLNCAWHVRVLVAEQSPFSPLTLIAVVIAILFGLCLRAGLITLRALRQPHVEAHFEQYQRKHGA